MSSRNNYNSPQKLFEKAFEDILKKYYEGRLLCTCCFRNIKPPEEVTFGFKENKEEHSLFMFSTLCPECKEEVKEILGEEAFNETKL